MAERATTTGRADKATPKQGRRSKATAHKKPTRRKAAPRKAAGRKKAPAKSRKASRKKGEAASGSKQSASAGSVAVPEQQATPTRATGAGTPTGAVGASETPAPLPPAVDPAEEMESLLADFADFPEAEPDFDLTAALEEVAGDLEFFHIDPGGDAELQAVDPEIASDLEFFAQESPSTERGLPSTAAPVQARFSVPAPAPRITPATAQLPVPQAMRPRTQ